MHDHLNIQRKYVVIDIHKIDINKTVQKKKIDLASTTFTFLVIYDSGNLR